MSIYYFSGIPYSSDELYHHGVKGQKWGVRRYVNPDGTLTPEGRQRYGSIENFNASKEGQKFSKQNSSGSSGSGVRSFVSKHKRGLLIAGGILAAGAAAVVVSKVAGSNRANKGADAAKQIFNNGNERKSKDASLFGKKNRGSRSSDLFGKKNRRSSSSDLFGKKNRRSSSSNLFGKKNRGSSLDNIFGKKNRGSGSSNLNVLSNAEARRLQKSLEKEWIRRGIMKRRLF